VPIALRTLAMGEETLRHDQMQIVLGAGHGYIKQPAFFLDLSCRSSAEVRRHAAIDDVEQEHRLPFLTLGGMDRGQDQVVLVEQGYARLVAGGIGWIKRQLCEEAFARWIAARDLFKLDQVGATGLGILVDSVEVRFVPQPRPFEVGRPV
jgi:hypothetical protein